jgi:hypothetical protein
VVAADAGIHPSSLSEILNRAAKPQLETVIDLCRVCEVTVGWVLQNDTITPVSAKQGAAPVSSTKKQSASN